MNKNTKKNSKSKNKINKNKINKNKVAAAVETAPVTETAAVDNTPVPVVNIPAAVKRSKGRPIGSKSQSLVSLQSLIDVLPPTSQVPLSNRLIRSLNSLGIKLESTPFKSDTKGLAQISNAYKVASSNVSVLDLNQPEVTA